MSAQAGIFYHDGRPIEPGAAAQLRARIAAFGPDGSGEFVGAGLVMVHHALHVTPEDRHGCQPMVSRRGNVMTWDGRLDNRDDLRLQLWRDLGDEAGDVAIAMAAYERWGDEAFGRLIGDWSLALWDGAARELKLASDYAGNRGLYFRDQTDHVEWSTSLGDLVERTGVRDRLEPRFIVGYLSAAIPPDITPYVGVRSVTPGCVHTWPRGGRAKKMRHWDFSRDTIRFDDPRDYEARLRELLSISVAARLRSSAPVWAELSGGFDSSTVVCVGDRLLESGAVSAPSIETVSYVTDSSPESDERPFIAAVEQQRRARGQHVRAEDCVDLVDYEHDWVTPLHPRGVLLEMFRTASRGGGRVMLSGHPGDLIMGNYPESLAAMNHAIATVRPRAVLDAARAWSRASRRPIWHAAGLALTPYLRAQTRSKRSAVASLRRRGSTARNPIAAAADVFLVRPEWLPLWWSEKIQRSSRVARHAARWQHTLVDGVVEYTLQRTLQSPSELPAIHYTHPYTDRRLVEFVLAVPPAALNPPGQPRLLMKNALGCVLPPRILGRFSKGYVDPFKLRKVRAWSAGAAERLDSLFLVREGYVDRERLRHKLESVHAGSCRALGNIEVVLRLERWASSRQRIERADQLNERGARRASR